MIFTENRKRRLIRGDSGGLYADTCQGAILRGASDQTDISKDPFNPGEYVDGTKKYEPADNRRCVMRTPYTDSRYCPLVATSAAGESCGAGRDPNKDMFIGRKMVPGFA